MATTIATFADDETSMRYLEPFITEGLNKKLAISTPAGVYQGFRLSTSGVALTITVVGDIVHGDHAAVYQTLAGVSLSIRRTGNFTLNLASLASKTVAICLFATYSTSALTTAEIRAYEVLPSDTLTGATENAELVVLGTVVVPASGTIPPANITPDRRRPAWAAAAPDAVPWAALLRNPSFDYGLTGSSIRFGILDWINRADVAVGGAFRLGTTTLRSGAKSLEFNKTLVGASTGRIEQPIEIPVIPGTLVRVSGYVRQLIATTGGSYAFKLYWGDANSSPTASTTITVSTASIDAAFRLVEQTLAVPTGSSTLKTFTVEAIAATAGSTGVSVVFEDVQVYLEAGSALATSGTRTEHLKAGVVSSLIVEDPADYSLGQFGALLRFDRTLSPAGQIIIDRKDQDYTGGNVGPTLTAMGQIKAQNGIVSNGDVIVAGDVAGQQLFIEGNAFLGVDILNTCVSRGPITAEGGMIVSANRNIQLSGTGYVAHGSRSQTHHVFVATTLPISGGAPTSPGVGQNGVSMPSSSVAYFPIPLPTTIDRIFAVTTHSGSVASYTISLVAVSVTGVVTSVPSTGGSSAGNNTIFVTGGKQLTTGEVMYVQVSAPGSTLVVQSITTNSDCPP